MQPAPSFDQSPAVPSRLLLLDREQGIVGRFDDQKRPRPWRKHDERANEKCGPAGLPPSDCAEKKREQGKTRLHDGAAFVRALPFSEKGAVLKPEPGRLLDATDIDRSPRENGRYGKREISYNHDAVASQSAPRTSVPPCESGYTFTQNSP